MEIYLFVILFSAFAGFVAVASFGKIEIGGLLGLCLIGLVWLLPWIHGVELMSDLEEEHRRVYRFIFGVSIPFGAYLGWALFARLSGAMVGLVLSYLAFTAVFSWLNVPTVFGVGFFALWVISTLLVGRNRERLQAVW